MRAANDAEGSAGAGRQQREQVTHQAKGDVVRVAQNQAAAGAQHRAQHELDRLGLPRRRHQDIKTREVRGVDVEMVREDRREVLEGAVAAQEIVVGQQQGIEVRDPAQLVPANQHVVDAGAGTPDVIGAGAEDACLAKRAVGQPQETQDGRALQSGIGALGKDFQITHQRGGEGRRGVQGFVSAHR